MTDVWDDDDRAIARALGGDAPGAGSVDPGAVADYEAVVGYLPFAEVPPRDLEDQVVAAALARRPASARALDAKRNASARRSRSSRTALAAIVAAAAAAVIVVLLIAGRPVPGSPGARIEPAAATGDLSRVLAEPDTRQGVLRTPQGDAAGRLVLDPRGDGYLTDLAPAAAAQPTRWLWLDIAAGPVRVGQISDASIVHFVVRGDAKAVRGVIVTSSPAAQVPTAPTPVSFRGSLPAA